MDRLNVSPQVTEVGDALPEVTVFTRPGCQPCRATQRALTAAGIPFTTVDLTADADGRQMALALGYTSAPIVTVEYPDGVGDEHWSGYRPERITGLARELEPSILDQMVAAEEQRREGAA